jgi:NAD(P)H dehydrogenase (quinone)
MTSKPTILVTSAAGKTGLAVALQLREKGFPVRAFVRRIDARSDQLSQAGCEIFKGDQYVLRDMQQAMEGVARAYHCPPTAPNGLHFTVVFCAAAAQAGISHTVTLGQWLAARDHPSLFTRETYLGEALLAQVPGMTVTKVIPGWFADNYLMVLEMAAQLGQLTMPLGDGDAKTNAPPSNEDIARVAVAALIDPDTHAGARYRPTGPELMSPNEIAAAIGRALGRKVAYNNISERMFLKAMRAVPPSNFSEAAVTQLRIYCEEYRRGSFAVNAPTDVVERLSGQPPERFEDIVARVAKTRPGVRRSFRLRLRAVADFTRILLARPYDTARLEKNRDFIQMTNPVFVQDDPVWRSGHSPKPNLAEVA